MRMCIGCRQRDRRDALARVVRVPDGVFPEGVSSQGGVVVDLRRRLPGRGASVHPRVKCIEVAVRRGALKRALGASAGVDELLEGLRAQYEARVAGLLLAARRSGQLVIGTDAVADAIGTRSLHLLAIASDARGRRAELLALAEAAGIAAVVWGERAQLGKFFGRAEVAIMGVRDEGMAEALRDATDSIASLDGMNRFAEDA
ncbi:MAG: DUF448 domain-containing protein [Deltaproteobacteria bacterium]|nr:DUF448 domain-containing protein [Deltaproteobacteria bacterium]